MEEGLRYFQLDRVTAEDPEGYCCGGYCPVDIGDRIANRFKIVHKLGYGGFSTVWLAREEGKSRFVALKIVAADDSETYETFPKIASILQMFPSFLLTEYERLFVDSRNGRHLCQVFPVLGPTLDALTDFHHRLYTEHVQDFARQLARAIEVMHSNDLCHGDLTTRNIALGLSRGLDHLSENEIWALFPPKMQEIRLQSEDQTNSESTAPKYAVEAMDLTRLPSDYLSSKLYILDFDQAYSSLKSPRSLLGIGPRYLAPESIFELNNGPPADVWALGCLIFRMRCGLDIFEDLPETPSNAISRMYGVLGGHLLDRWKTVPFDGDGWPAHDGLQGGVDYRDFSGHYIFPYKSLQDYVMESFDLKRAKNVGDEIGILEFCRYLPTDAFCQGHLKQEWAAENATPISREEADYFYDLMLQVFEYDPSKRITASNMLLHPWFGAK